MIGMFESPGKFMEEHVCEGQCNRQATKSKKHVASASVKRIKTAGHTSVG
jgi:hypothetical protein